MLALQSLQSITNSIRKVIQVRRQPSYTLCLGLHSYC
uniref:Uncharacterized protein n=1 Tax=Arundo donax TaxID=35708 RepID=A0A0A9B467_ARUDO